MTSDYVAVSPDDKDYELIGEILINRRSINAKSKTWALVKYMDDEVVLFKNFGFQRIFHGKEKRHIWDEQIEGQYWYYANIDSVDDPFTNDEYVRKRLEPLLEVRGVGESAIDSLIDNNFDTLESILHADNEELESVPNLGSVTVERINDEFENYINRVADRR